MAQDRQRDNRAQMAALGFGSGPYVEQLRARLRDHFDKPEATSPTRHDALVIGLFGEWGCGKSHWLKHLQQHFLADCRRARPDRPLSVPVFFNAWRFEAEEHLIIPLLKTTQHTLQSLALPEAKDSAGKQAWKWLKKRARLTAQSTFALAAGLKLSLDIPGVGKAGFDPKAALEDERKRWDRIEQEETDAAAAADPFADFADLASLYYDFQHTMQRITGRSDDASSDSGGENGGESDAEPRLNLLFLIDDLDRCLPEKAVQMLEAIKLFLDVPGCAFVLALDDEVVERGIAHRYRDYLQNHDQQFDAVAHSLHPARYRDFESQRQVGPQAPITGAEYLEKIVQIPLRIPPPRRSDIGRFLRQHYPDLFVVPEKPESEDSPDELTARGKHRADEAQTQYRQADRQTDRQADRQQAELLALFQRAVPANPRKLIRSAELLDLQLRVATARGWQSIDRLTLARLVLLQLFAPEVYRFCQRQPYHTFLTQMEQWQNERLFIGRNRLEDAVKTELKEQRDKLEQVAGDAATADERVQRLEALMLPFISRLRDCQRQRGTFDPVKLIDPKQPSDRGLRRYFDLLDDRPVAGPVASPDTSPGDEQHSASPRSEPAERSESLAAAELADASLFVSLATSTDPLHWREASETEASALAGRRLPDEVFEQILPALQSFEADQLLRWIEHFFDWLSPAQLERLYHDSKLLATIDGLLQEDAKA